MVIQQAPSPQASILAIANMDQMLMLPEEVTGMLLDVELMSERSAVATKNWHSNNQWLNVRQHVSPLIIEPPIERIEGSIINYQA